MSLFRDRNEVSTMALDGITISALTNELREKLIGGRLLKIAQPEVDELLLTIKVIKEQYRLDISSSATLPLMYITDVNKPSPMTAPNFCMILRKHLNNAKIIDITQPGLERIINFRMEHYNEMGDLCEKFLIVELMGKHSNIIFTDVTQGENGPIPGKIIDSIKKISANVSSVREVLPGRDYFIPMTSTKCNPLDCDFDIFKNLLKGKADKLSNSILGSFTGISPIISEEICYLAGIDSDLPSNVLSEENLQLLFNSFNKIMSHVNNNEFFPIIYSSNGMPKEYNSFPLSIYSDLDYENIHSISECLEKYYKNKNQYTRIRQKSFDLRKIITTDLEKNYKKYDLQLKQLKDTDKRDKYKVYGELITSFGHSIPKEATSFDCNNYYTGEDITIPLDNTLTPIENANKYFDKYEKLKRTFEALSSIIKETESEIKHLESILNSLDIAQNEEDLKELKEEMIQSGYIRRKSQDKKVKIKSKPFHYLSSDGFHMYVGKNNIQNEELTFKLANGGDWWFHSKTFPGSHVIVKTEGQELPDRTFEEAARLAAHYSKGRNQDKVEIDYVQRKHVKKVAGAKPGFVIYHTNYSLAISPDISDLELINE